MRMHTLDRNRRSIVRSGLASLEFAVLAPVLVGLFVGMLELGRAVSVRETLSDATRRACRTASLSADTNALIEADARAVLNANALPGDRATITIFINGSQASISTAEAGDKITVRVTIPVADITWVPSQYVSGSLKAETSMMRQR